jgi:hypothetical protein
MKTTGHTGTGEDKVFPTSIFPNLSCWFAGLVYCPVFPVVLGFDANEVYGNSHNT